MGKEMTEIEQVVLAIRLSFMSDNGVKEVNVVDALGSIARGLESVANAITPSSALPGEDKTGGNVNSLTESVMGVTAGAVKICNAIDRLGNAIEDELSGASRNNAN